MAGGAEVLGAGTRITKGGGVVAETQQRANDAETLRYIGAAQDLLRDADSHVRLRTYKDAGTDEYGALADSIGEILGLARVALSLAGSAEADGRE
jgi:hypothetical protein